MILLEDKIVTEKCPYCATHLENEPEAAAAMIAPESLLPFGLDHRKARAEFDTWIHALWFAPNQLKKLADLGQFAGAYVPFWTYDSMTYSDYTGQRGDNYTTTETYVETDSKGRQHTRTRTVVRTAAIWYFLSAALVLVPALIALRRRYRRLTQAVQWSLAGVAIVLTGLAFAALVYR